MVLASEAASIARPAIRRGHIVDVLIEERAPRLASSPVWPALRPSLYALLGYRKARQMADAIAPLRGHAALAYASELLALKVEVRGLERLPRQGRLVLIANHPTGIADGVALYDAVRALRPDIAFYANADAHRISPGLSDLLIPVEWVDEKRTREKTRLTLAMTREAMEAGRALAIFPAGRIARRGPDGRLADPPWATSAISIARKYAAPIAPVHLAGPNSTLFHLFHRVSNELRDMTVFHELLNKRGGRYRMTVGPLIDPDSMPADAGEATQQLKGYIETQLAAHPDRPYR
ncbi:MAG TPA: 1-acyl-sn-glycerol-3-phosphate acyltransferase [Caulobacteraceae bacterium]|nr:1-acyl-sn-glycerol-3-phosphate acyltransferase [Caulobacteraceae bacterium]